MRESDKYNTSEVQDELLCMMKDIHAFLVRMGIRYSLCGGSLLGAIRHNGFIPWDDDMDIIVDRENFDKLIRAFSKCETYTFARVLWIYRIRRKDSGRSKNIPTIDVFVMDNTPNSPVLRKMKVLFIQLLQGMMKQEVHYADFSLPYRICLGVTHAVGKLFSDDRKYSWYNRVSILGNRKKTQYVSTFNDLFKLVKICYDSDTMEHLQLHRFEDTEFYITEKYDSYLTRQYGDYMTPVAEKDRVPEHMQIEK